MLSRPHFQGLFHDTAKTLGHAPKFFLLLQLPMASTELIDALVGLALPDNPLWTVALFVPYFYIAAIFTTAATYYSIQCRRRGKPLCFRETIQKVRRRAGLLIKAALVLGAVILVGMLAFVLPGIYLSALYLFVPYLIMSESTNELMVILNRATSMSKSAFFDVVLAVVLVLLASAITFWIGKVWQEAVEDISRSWLTLFLCVVPIKMALTMMMGSIVDVWLCHFYLRVKSKAKP